MSALGHRLDAWVQNNGVGRQVLSFCCSEVGGCKSPLQLLVDLAAPCLYALRRHPACLLFVVYHSYRR